MKKIHNPSSDEVVTQIEQLCNTQSYGSIFMLTAKKEMVQIILTEGKIIAAHCQTKHGMDALKLAFKSVNFILFYFIKRNELSDKSKADTDLPPTDQIIETFKKIGLNVDSVDNKILDHEIIDIDQITKITASQLAIHLGPMAAMVCEEYFQDIKNLPDVIEAIDKISDEIDNPTDRAEFKSSISKQIQLI